MLSCVLAEDSERAWRITFQPEERHLFVYYTGRSEPLDWMSIERLPGVATAG